MTPDIYVGYQVPSTVTLIDCGACGTRHPATRLHCDVCSRPSLVIVGGQCTPCREKAAAA